MRYSAFISYSHSDERWARWLHRSLEAYRIPKRLHDRMAGIELRKDRLLPVFRDSDELAASSDLDAVLRKALEESHNLIVICSPNSAKSRWVGEEVKSFIEMGRGDRILCLIVDGEPHSTDPEKECFPPALLRNGAAEPLAVDLRPGHESKQTGKLKLIAGILDFPYGELRQRDQARRQRRLAVAASVLSIALVTMTALAVFAFISRNEAVRQRDLAEQRTLTAQRTVSFVKDLFKVGDPSEARGRMMTVDSVLNRGLQQIRTGLDEEPAVRADLGLTLGEVYTSLGELEEADRLIRWTFTIDHDEAEVRARQLAAFADVRLRLGDVDRALPAAERAVAIARTTSLLDPAVLPRAFVTLGEAQIANGDFDAARTSLNEAYRLAVVAFGPVSSDVALVLEDFGQIETLERNWPAARQRLTRALAIRRRVEGEMSPSVSDNMIGLARIAINEGNSALAERLVKARLPIDEQVLGRDHPSIAEMLNDLGRALLEQRKYGEARGHLERAVTIMLASGGSELPQLAYIESNLGIVFKALGDFGRARSSLERARRITEALEDPVNIVVRVELADLACNTGNAASGRGQAATAREELGEAYANQPWRAAWAQIVEGSCLLRSGDGRAAQRLITGATQEISRRWRPGSHFRVESETRLTAARLAAAQAR